MSRTLRMRFPNAWYYVSNRGLSETMVFKSGQHCQMFLALLADVYQQFGVETHAYCLLGQQYHLILHTRESNLSRAMRHLNGVYTQRYNRLEDREGPIFRGRYHAIVMDPEHFLLPLSRHIHLIPVRSGMVFRPEQYKWSSYRAYSHRQSMPPWLYGEVLFTQIARKSVQGNYQAYVEDALLSEPDTFFETRRNGGILGDKKFIAGLPAGENLIDVFHLNQSLEKLMQTVANFCQVSIENLKQRGHRYQENTARNLAIYYAAKCTAFSHTDIATYFGNISPAAVSQIKRRMQNALNHGVQEQIDQLSGYFHL